MAIPDHICGAENSRGVRCTLGDGHTIKCRFKPYIPSDKQLDLLLKLRRKGPIETFGSDGAARSLDGAGFIRRKYIGMRWWKLSLTRAGLWLLQNLPK